MVADRPGIQLGAVSTITAFDLHCVTVPRIVAYFVQSLAAHGMRLMDQTKLAADATKAATARIIAELSKIISTSDS